MKNRKLNLNKLKVESFTTTSMSNVRAGELYRQVDGGDSIMECPTGCIGDHCQPDLSQIC
ncbi:MAG: pinensin family lanthipeptide [Cyclobacteriaceae bacterium]